MKVSGRSILLWGVFLSGLAIYVFLEFSDDGEMPPPPPVVHELIGQEEGCVQCHGVPEGMAPFHNPAIIGCSPCHGGQALATTKAEAHTDLIRIPGNLADVQRTCGAANCHQSIAHRVAHSLMATMSGVVSVDRFVFGELELPEGHFHIEDIGYSAADTHLRQLCASCHLGNQKEQLGPITELSRGGGCNACHLNYSAAALTALQAYQETPAQVLAVHPQLSLEVSDAHCFGCHSRSSRISLNYAGWHETPFSQDEVDVSQSQYRLLDDGRIVTYIQEDVHHQLGLSCIDCHHVDEVMGDGQLYQHKEEALRVACLDCHRDSPYPSLPYAQLDPESKKLLALRGWEAEDKHFVQTASNLSLINVWLDTLGQAQLKGKNNDQLYTLSPPAEVCTRGGGHARLSCEACHTSWAPQCIGCHNTFEPHTLGFDLLDQQKVRGKWVEHVGVFFHDAPSLGVVQVQEAEAEWTEKIRTFIPGMSLSIDTDSFYQTKQPEQFHRLFAASAAHTTQRIGRSCASCHTNPLALGYGRGTLSYDTTRKPGQWTFTPEYAAEPEDGLPQDAWIGFLENSEGQSTTRTFTRPFTLREQQRILTVGACLSCHEEKDPMLINGITNFPATIKRAPEVCVLPDWE